MKTRTWFALASLFAAVWIAGCGTGAPTGGASTGHARSGSAGGVAGGETVVAQVGSETITHAEVEERVRAQLVDMDQRRYQLMKGALEAMIEERLIEQAAAAAGMDSTTLLAAEVDAKVEEPTEEEMVEFFEANKDRLRSGERDYEKVRDPLRNYMTEQRKKEIRQTYVAGLKESISHRILLEEPRLIVEVPETAQTLGDENAPVTIVEFADFECPACRKVQPVVERVLHEYTDEVRYVFRDFPLSDHARATPASLAALCAADQGRYWDYFRELLLVPGDLSDEDLANRAATIGLDPALFDACYVSGLHEAEILESQSYGRSLGVHQTPTFFVNGRRVIGAVSYEDLKAVVDEELARVGG